VETKGGFRKFTSKRIIFTSNKNWDKWYPNIPDMGAFARRITDVIYV